MRSLGALGVIVCLALLPAPTRAACDPVVKIVSKSWKEDPMLKEWGRPGHSHCTQPYSWDELINGYKDRHITYKAGGLAKRLEPGGYETWVCLLDTHPCGDPFYCWVYHETNKVFTPWGTNTELEMHFNHTRMAGSGPPTTTPTRADCPPHSVISPSGDCACIAGYLCDPGTDCTDCVPACDDTCEYANDAECDDPSVPGSTTSVCAAGTDDTDCGIRCT